MNKQQLEKDAKYLLAGGIAGCISRSSVAPLERVKILFQVQDILRLDKKSVKYSGVFASLKRIVREEGYKGLFRGNGTNCVRVFPYAATQFFVFEKMKPLLRSNRQDSHKLANLFGGAMAGVVSVCVTYPLDFVRARLTIQNSEMRYTGIAHALQSIAKKEGVLALYRGISPTVIGIAPYVGLNFMVFEALKTGAPKDEHGKPNILYLLGCGAVAGACGQTAAYPFDLLRRRFQVATLGEDKPYSGVGDGLRRIIAKDGVLGLYKGLLPNFIKVVPSVAVMFVSNDLMKRLLI